MLKERIGKYHIKKILKSVLMLSLAANAFIFGVAEENAVYAGQATSYTYTVNEDGDWVRTQDAYLPDLTITGLGLNKPEEMYIDENNILYIADTGNKRIILYDITEGTVKEELKNEKFKSPRGVFVTKDNKIYVADSAAKTVFVFDSEHKLVNTLGKPETPLFADTNYEPKRIAVDDGGNIFIIGEGVYNGIIQLAETGEFLGYFAVNDATLSISERIQSVFFTREQLAKLMDKNPVVFTNVFVDKSGIVYSATSGLMHDGMKKHSTNGTNMFVNPVWADSQLTDVYVDSRGLIYTCSSQGYIYVYSKAGEIIYEIGSKVTTEDIAGLFTKLSSVAVDSFGTLWALDTTKGYVQSFKPTEYANLVYEAMELYESGYYPEAMAKWNEVLKLNQMSALAHNGVGKAYLHDEDYENAMVHFEVANNKEYYSEAFWEVRNTYIKKYLGTVLLIILVLIIIANVIKHIDKKNGRLNNAKKAFLRKCDNIPVIRDIKLAFGICRHPMDLYYEIRKSRKGSFTGAVVLYLLFFAIYMFYQTGKGFIYQYTDIEDMDMTAVVTGFFAAVILFTVCNYLVTSITDGDGTLKQVFMIPAFGLIPAGISMLGVTIVSHVLTYNESFLLTIAMVVGITWSIVIIFTGFSTVHDYTFKETVKSFVITALFMIIFAIVLIIISIMWESLYSFLMAFGKELIGR